MAEFTIQKIDHVAIDVTDVNRSRLFYAGLLGLIEIPRPASFTFPGAWFRIGGEVLHIVGRAPSGSLTLQHFCLSVADVKSAAKVFEDNGVPVVWDTRYKIPGIDRFLFVTQTAIAWSSKASSGSLKDLYACRVCIFPSRFMTTLMHPCTRLEKVS